MFCCTVRCHLTGCSIRRMVPSEYARLDFSKGDRLPLLEAKVRALFIPPFMLAAAGGEGGGSCESAESMNTVRWRCRYFGVLPYPGRFCQSSISGQCWGLPSCHGLWTGVIAFTAPCTLRWLVPQAVRPRDVGVSLTRSRPLVPILGAAALCEVGWKPKDEGVWKRQSSETCSTSRGEGIL